MDNNLFVTVVPLTVIALCNRYDTAESSLSRSKQKKSSLFAISCVSTSVLRFHDDALHKSTFYLLTY